MIQYPIRFQLDDRQHMYVVGTAGHVDHGKSTLVKTLTGIDPDRWEEEQRREMTIDLGFAWLQLPGGQTVSIIDVPGHERFIKNMLAGVGGIDAALLVIAADESVMPQTEEHLAILDLLEIRHGVIVLTKADLVEPDWLALVQDDVRARLAHTTLADAPFVAVSARTRQGLPELLAALEQVLGQTPSRASGRGSARLPIDRSFTIGGFGTVVTGTLIDGPLAIGDEIEILPRGLRARVRGLQSHRARSETALPGTRLAVNLVGVSHHEIVRGDVLARPGQIQPTDVLDARLRLTPSARPVEQNDRLELFVGASEVPCRVTLLDSDVITPGQAGWVQFRLERPIALAYGDRYIIRQPSPSQTLGGGRIVDPHPARHRRFRPEVIAALEALARGTPADLVRRVLADGQPHTSQELIRSSGLAREQIDRGLAELHEAGESRSLGSTSEGWQISSIGWTGVLARLDQVLAGYHRRYPLRAGMPREELRSRLKLVTEAFEDILASAPIQDDGTTIRHAGHVPTPTPTQQRDIRSLVEQAQRAPYMPPTPDLEGELLAFMFEQRLLIRIAPEIAFAPNAYDAMVGWVRTQIDTHGSVTVAQVRDQFGTTRKYALALLEHLDERKITRRVEDVRVLY